MNIDPSSVYQVRLVGRRRFYIDTSDIFKYITLSSIMKLKDTTASNYDFSQLAIENNLKGFFVREMLSKLENAPETEKDEIQKAMEIGLDVLERQD